MGLRVELKHYLTDWDTIQTSEIGDSGLNKLIIIIIIGLRA